MSWTWSEITSDVRAAEGVQIRAGRSDEGTQVGPTQISLTLDNRTGDYSPRNPNGTNYGTLSKGTPIEVRITRINDTFTRAGALGTDADSGLAWTTLGSTWATTGTAATSALGSANTFNQATVDAGGHDVDVTHVSSISAVTTGAAWVDATIVRRVDDSNFYRVHTEFTTSGTIFCKIARVVGGSSSDLTANTDTGVSYSAGTVIATRVRAVGARLQIRAWLASGAEPTTWTVEVDDDEVNGTGVGLYEWRVAGNTNAGTLTCTIDDFRSDVIRAVTPVPEWPSRWDMSGNNVTSPIVGAGILRRLGQGQQTLRSPMYRQISGYTNLVGYWPLEDGTAATRPANVVAGAAGTAIGMTFGVDGPAGSASAATFANADPTSKISGLFRSASTTAGWQISWSAILASLPGAGVRQMLAWFTSSGFSWAVSLDSGVYVLRCNNADGTQVLNSNVSFSGTGEPDEWITFRMKATQSGGNIAYEFAWFVQDSETPWGTSGSFTGTVGALRSWTANGNSAMQNGSICHVFGVTTGNDDLQSYDALRAFDGYAREKAGDRLTRLCSESNVPLHIIGDTADTAPMGVQRPATFLTLARECEDADQGVLHERGAGLGYLVYAERTTTGAAVLALDFDDGHIADPPEPVDDDQRLRNQIKLRRPDGGEVTVEDTTSITVNGLYVDELEVNLLTDAQLVDNGYWRLHLGTADELRWPRIVLDLARNPDLIADWCKVRIGSRVTVANPPDQVAGADLDLIVEGWTEIMSTFQWRVVLVCSPAAPWRIAVADSSPAVSDSTTLGAGRDTTQTSWSFSTTNPAEVWSTADEPYDVMCGGERITVTSMGAVSGSGPYTQTATVTRSVNGIVKAHDAGAAITLAEPHYASI